MIHKAETRNVSPVTGQMNLVFRARMLWRDLGTWLATYMLSIAGGYGNQEVVAERLYRLPLDYGNIMKLFFGEKLSEDYINLLSTYIITLQSLFISQMRGDVNSANEFTKQLYQNINLRAAFFAQINPYWQESVWRSLLYNFNGLILDFSTTLLAKEYKTNIDVFDRLLSMSSVIGDYFSEGLINYLNYSGTPPQKTNH